MSAHDTYSLQLVPTHGMSGDGAGDDARDFLEQIKQGEGPVLLNLSGLQMIDSLGMSVIAGLLRECQKRKWHLAVQFDSPSIGQVMRMMHFDKHLELKDVSA